MRILIATLFLTYTMSSFSQSRGEPKVEDEPTIINYIYKVGSDSCEIYIPPAPNEMSSVFCTTNIWRVITHCKFDRYHLQLINRWGTTIWETTKQDESFDIFKDKSNGGVYPAGVYYWLMTGLINETEEFQLKGYMTIIK